MRHNADGCPSRDLLSAYFDGELPDKWRIRTEDHLTRCSSCRAVLLGFARVRDVIAREPELQYVDAMARVRTAVASEITPRTSPHTLWTHRLAVPLPLAALAAGVLVVLCAGLVLSMARRGVSTVRFTAAPTGLTQFEIEGDPEDVWKLLQALNQDSPDRIVTFDIPRDYQLVRLGVPELHPAVGDGRR